jgi:hypothetical protein
MGDPTEEPRYHHEMCAVLHSVRRALHELGEERAMAAETGYLCDVAVRKIDDFVKAFEE